jgi:hypothetical protein
VSVLLHISYIPIEGQNFGTSRFRPLVLKSVLKGSIHKRVYSSRFFLLLVMLFTFVSQSYEQPAVIKHPHYLLACVKICCKFIGNLLEGNPTLRLPNKTLPQITVFWVVTQCRGISPFQHFGGISYPSSG